MVERFTGQKLVDGRASPVNRVNLVFAADYRGEMERRINLESLPFNLHLIGVQEDNGPRLIPVLRGDPGNQALVCVALPDLKKPSSGIVF